MQAFSKNTALCRQFGRHLPSTPVLQAAPTAVSSVQSRCCSSRTPEKPSHIFSKSRPDTPTPSLIPNGQTPPIACPIRSSTSSGASIFAFAWKKCLVFCIVNPGISGTHDQHRLSVHQKRQGLCNRPASVCSASAASSTVAEEETGNSLI